MHDDVEELGDVRLQRECAQPPPSISCGLTVRSAPARMSLAVEDSSRARAMITMSGRSARADNVT